MTSHAQRDVRSSPAPARSGPIRSRAKKAWRFVAGRFSSSLTRRIVVLNLGGLFVLVVGFLLLNQFRADIIESRVQSLTTQADIIAAAIAASAAVETDAITIDPEKLLQLAPGESAMPAPSDDDSIEFSINPERIGPVLHRLVTPTRTRAYVYDRDGQLILDSDFLAARGAVERSDLGEAPEELTLWQRISNEMQRFIFGETKPRRKESWNANGNEFPEVVGALQGRTRSVVSLDAAGQTIVSVAVPIQRMMAIRGALRLSTQGGDIDKVIAAERWALVRFFLVLAAVMFVLSLSLANTIAEPVRKLAEAAERVRHGIKSRRQIPDFSNRTDEIGHLSRALRDMTQALYNRMDAIETFAADVAHELKNPLTSLRSALETLPRVKANGPSRDRLIEVMQHDVRRLDRLITDISDASRLDAELARGDFAPVDIAALLRAVVAMMADSPRGHTTRLELSVAPPRRKPARSEYVVLGHDSRLAQVAINLIENACSFSEPGGEVRVGLVRKRDVKDSDGTSLGDQIVLTVDDDGPGIPPHALERIFERFYTDRPNQGFGQNSGLGLSISRQIVVAHGGQIWACNRPPDEAAKAKLDDEGDGQPIRHGAGARFVLSLPAIGA